MRWWHSFIFRVPPTIVLEAAERMKNQEFASVSASCRALVGLGFRVVVDASHNAISEEAAATLPHSWFRWRASGTDVCEWC